MKEEIRETVKSILTAVVDDLKLSLKDLTIYDGLYNGVKYLDCIIELQSDEKVEFIIRFEDNKVNYYVKNLMGDSDIVTVPNNRIAIVQRLERENQALHDLFSKM